MSDSINSQALLLAEDDKSRLRALDLESFIVEAPAGAGKTELLTQRFLKLLKTVREPEEVIAITFTNKAAAEMRLRILDSLNMAAGGVPPPQPHKQTTYELGIIALQHAEVLGWNLLQNPSRLRIYTIDSLSSNLARQMPLLSRFGSQPGVREDASLYFDEAATRTLELLEDGRDGEKVRQALRYFDNDAFKLNKLLASMLARRDQWLEYTQNRNAPEEAEAALGHMLVQDLASAAKFVDASLQSELMPVARYAAANLPCENPIALLHDWETPILAKPEALSMWRALCDLLLTGKDHKGRLRKNLDKNMGLPATPEAKPYKEKLTQVLDALRATSGAEEALARLRLLPNPKHNDDVWQIIAALDRLLNLAVAQLWLVFQEHGEVDFIEISQRALQALEDESGTPTDLALKLDYRIQHLLVDEFQDTSPTQVKLLSCLTLGWTPGDGRTLFAVGDPMQSIYRFRKANVGLFLRVAEEGIGHVPLTKLKLCRNNRSCPPVVDWVNTAFENVFPAQDGITRGAIRYRDFVATRADEAGAGVQIHALVASRQEAADEDETEAADVDAGESRAESVNSLRQHEASTVISIIKQTRAQHPGKKIAVLVRARSHLKALVAEIRRHHPTLHFQAVEIEALAERQIVQDLLALTHALHHRADRVNWLAILRAPWCGLKLADLQVLAADDHHSTVCMLMNDQARVRAMSADGRERLLHVREILTEALAQRGRQTTSRWVHGTWLMLGGADCLWQEGDVRDVQAFFQRIEQLDSAGQFSLENLASEVDKLYAAPDAEADESLQFMTIHKSKGLEFDTVILPGLDRKTGGNEQALVLWEEVTREGEVFDEAATDLVIAPLIPKGAGSDGLPTPYDYLERLEKERDDNEASRLLYVAATRAERSLHLVGAAHINARTGEPQAPKNTFLSLLWPMVSAHFFAALKQELPAKNGNAASGLDITGFVPKLVRLAKPEIPVVLRERAALKMPQAGDTKIDGDDITKGNRLDASVGTLAHRYVEMIARQGQEAWTTTRINSLRPAMQRWLTQQSHTDKAAIEGAERVVAALHATLATEQGRWVLQQRPQSSVELAIAALDNDTVATHVVDRTFIEDGIRWIIDYKSVPLSADIPDANLSLFAERYRPQLERYAALFKDEGLPIRKAVFFLSLGRLLTLD